jgi:hypothetical protein
MNIKYAGVVYTIAFTNVYICHIYYLRINKMYVYLSWVLASAHVTLLHWKSRPYTGRAPGLYAGLQFSNKYQRHKTKGILVPFYQNISWSY